MRQATNQPSARGRPTTNELELNPPGVAVKEGFCYGKPEAAGIALLLPLLLLGHLTQLLPPAALQVVLAGAVGATSVFAGRKYTQAVKDDIGDKSVFE
jgi:uncharacterized integral membrane protein